MRRPAALLWLLLAIAPAAAVPPGDKPVDADRAADEVTRAADNAMHAADEATRATDRLRNVGTCVSAHPPGRDDDPSDLAFVTCECAADRVPAGRAGDSAAIEQAWRQCRSEAAASSTLGGKPSASAEPGAARPGAAAVAPDAEAKPDGAAPGAGLAAWLGGLPRWAWVAIPALFVLLVMMLRRRDPRGDLVAPPRKMRAEPTAPPRLEFPDEPPPG